MFRFSCFKLSITSISVIFGLSHIESSTVEKSNFPKLYCALLKLLLIESYFSQILAFIFKVNITLSKKVNRCL